MGDVNKLKIWQMSKNLSVSLYREIRTNKLIQSYSRFKSQLTNCVVSITANIAEGDESNTLKQSMNYFYYAKVYCAELITYLIIAKELNMIKGEKIDMFLKQAELISIFLYKII